jgi:hypothetical protein
VQEVFWARVSRREVQAVGLEARADGSLKNLSN